MAASRLLVLYFTQLLRNLNITGPFWVLHFLERRAILLVETTEAEYTNRGVTGMTKLVEVTEEMHRHIKIAAAKEGLPMREMTDRLLRMGRLAETMRQPRFAEEKAEYHVEADAD